MLDADYFRRIDAMHYVLAHDDGQGAAGIAEADVVPGRRLAQSSKTPTCFYLANRGIKAANVPIVPGAPLPPELDDAALPGGRPDHRGQRADRDPPPPPAADRRRRRAPGHERLHRPRSGEGRDPGGAPALHPAGLAGDRRDAPLHRGDGGDRAATDGGVAPAPEARHAAAAAPLDPAADVLRRRRRRSAGARDPARRSPPLVLASASAARRAVLAAAGLAFTAEAAAVDEAAIKESARAEGIPAGEAAMLLAEAKARRVARRARPDALVIGADQILVCDGAWFDKPADMAAARAQLLALRGRRTSW